IAAVQMDCRLADKAHNLATIQNRLRETAAQGARLAIFPECALTGYSFESKEEDWPHAETIPGPTTETLSALCRELGIWVIFGSHEREQQHLFNACALVGPKGETVSYRKIHLPCLGVDRFTAPGDRPFTVHDLGGLRVGMTICYDGSFPESSRVLALLGAELIVLPTNWPEAARKAAQLLVPARALEDGAHHAGAHRGGGGGGLHFMGMR